MSISLPGLARFGCDLSATVGGIPNFGQTSQSRIRPLRHREQRGPGATRRKGMAWHCARHRAAFINQSGSLGRDPWPDATCDDLPVGRPPGRATMAPLYPRSLREGGVRQRTFKPQFRTRLTVALRQQPGEAGEVDSRNRPITASYTHRQITFWALWGADAAVNALPALRRSRR